MLKAFEPPKAAIDFAPMIAFSYGYCSVRFQSVFVMEHLAIHDFARFLVGHPKDTLFDFDDDGTGHVLLEY